MHRCSAPATYPEVSAGSEIRPVTRVGAPGRHASAADRVGPRISSLFGLAPCGVYPAPDVTAGAVRSYRTFSPLPFVPCGTRAVYFLWHLPSRGLDAAIPDVIRHTALRSSDFPLPDLLALVRQRPPGLPACLMIPAKNPSAESWIAKRRPFTPQVISLALFRRRRSKSTIGS